MELKDYINTSINSGEMIAIIGNLNVFENILNYKHKNVSVLEHLLNFSDQEKIIKAFYAVNLECDILEELMCNLSLCHINKIKIVEALLKHDDTCVFYNIHKGLNDRDKQNLKRILKAMQDNNKKIILISNDIEFFFDFVKKLIIVDKDTIINEFDHVDWYNEEIYKYVNKPPIINFVMECKNQNIKLDSCLETKELIKAIYRSVGK